MKKHLLILSVFLMIRVTVAAQEPVSPLILNQYAKATSYHELVEFIHQAGGKKELLTKEVIGQSANGRDLYALFFSSSVFGKDTSKIRILLFAQQHGNEQSGKEGALLLVSELLKPENRYLFDRMDLALVPQVNPDGSERNSRRNANGRDLNRNHLILTEPETMALHRLFDRYLFEVTLDVHEYSPYGDAWKRYGYRKNTEVTFGTTTNINIPASLREFSAQSCLPFLFNYLNERGFSAFTYCPGGPPGEEYIRHSTFDVNDGRQSLGIENSFSFIQEGMNGRDDSIGNIRRRAEGQMTGMRGLLEFVYRHPEKIRSLVGHGRTALLHPPPDQPISIQSVHVPGGKPLKLPLLSLSTGRDTLVTVKDYRPLVRSLHDVEKPLGYLIPADCTLLVDWAKRHNFVQHPFTYEPGMRFAEYRIQVIDSIDFEGDPVVDPLVTPVEVGVPSPGRRYLFLPTNQLKGNLLVLALEPKSMLGLVTYKDFSHILQPGQAFPVIRVTTRSDE